MTAHLLSLCLATAWTFSAAAPITQLKPLRVSTQIASAGKATAVLVTPEDEALGPICRTLASELSDRGVSGLETVPASTLVSADWQLSLPDLKGRNLMALGNINNNRLLAVLWGEGYVAADSVFPGQGGYIIRTVHDPFARGANVLVLAASDAAGLQTAVKEFLDTYVPPTAADYTLQQPVTRVEFTPTERRFFPTPVHHLSSKRQPQYSNMEYFRKLLSGQGIMDAQGNVIRKATGTLADVTGAIARLMQTYFRTGAPELPALMKQVLDRNRHLLSVAPKRIEMEAASAAHVRWWDLAEELPIWTDRDRLDITNALLADALQGHEGRAAHRLVREGYVQVVDENHGTSSALNTFSAWRYFDKYYDLPETDYWMRVAHATFAGQCASHQILEDAAGYLAYCPIQTMKYAFAARDVRFFTLGIARTYAEYVAQCTVNNLGLSTGFGDSPSLVLPSTFECLAPAAWYYRDPYLWWVAQNMLPQACGLRVFQSPIPIDLSVPPVEPSHWTGMSVFPIYKQTLTKGKGSKQFVTLPAESAGDEWFSKVVFREAWDPESQYLMLDGGGKFGSLEGYPPSPAGHRHDDANTLINFTDHGRMWLVDHTYASRNIKDHSGLYITRNGQVGYKVHEARLMNAAEGGDLALCRSVFEGFSGADWERTIFWQRGDWFVVLDRVIARQEGDYAVRCSFRGLGEHELSGPGMRLRQQDRYCDIISDGGAELDIVPFDFPAQKEWETWYEHADATAKVFQQNKSGRLAGGDELTFLNLIYAGTSQAQPPSAQLVPVSERAALVQHDGREALCGLGSPPGVDCDATVHMITSRGILLTEITKLGAGEATVLSATQPVDLYVSAEGQCRLLSSAAVSVTLAGATQPMRLDAGEHELPVDNVPAALTELFAGCLPLARGRADNYQVAKQAKQQRAFGVQVQALQMAEDIAELCTADLDGDGADEWVIAGSRGVSAFRSTGDQLWEFETDKPCRALDVGDLDGDGLPEVLVGCEDLCVRALDSRGILQWRFECKPSTGTALPPTPDFIRIADLEGDGPKEVVVGANWVHCLDAAGELKWENYLRFSRGRICGDFAIGDVRDVNADGRQEVLACFLDSYHVAVLYDSEGNVLLPQDYEKDRKWGINTGLPQALLMGRFRGEGADVLFALGADTYLYTYWCAGRSAGQFAGRKAGSYVALASYQPEEGPPFIYGATDMGAVIAYRAVQPRTDEWLILDAVWTRVTGARITCLWSGDPGQGGPAHLLVGTKAGAAIILDPATGDITGRSSPTGSPVIGFVRAAQGLLAVHADGACELLRIIP